MDSRISKLDLVLPSKSLLENKTHVNRSRPLDPELGIKYIKNSLRVKSAEMDQIRECAASHNIAVCLGFSENDNDSLYIAQSLIERDGTISMTRRKIKATHMERTIFGDASGDCLRNVVDTSAGRVGALACWEHAQPLLKYHTHLQREQIHVGAWPPVTQFEGLGLYSMSREGRVETMTASSTIAH